MQRPAPLQTDDLCKLLGIERPGGLPDASITGITTLDAAGPDEAAFLARQNMKARAPESRAALILVSRELHFDDPRALAVPDVWAALLTLIEYFHPEPEPIAQRHPTAIVADSARIGENVSIGPYAVIGEDVRVGDGTRIGPHCILGDRVEIGQRCHLLERVSIMKDCCLGNRVIAHSGVVIGADGFRYQPIAGRIRKMPQVGNVIIGDEVEIGANSTIDRASFASTRIGDRTKIDNLVHIAHNCEIGSDCILVAQVGVAGSAKIGRGVVIAGQSGVADYTVVGDGVQIAGKSAVRGTVKPGSKVVGIPAIEAREFARLQLILRKLPDLYSRIRPALEEAIEEEDS